jgi:dihydrofolate reductase
MTINIIVAIAENRAIGFENKLLYWLPNDLKRFKSLTTGHTIIMGRKTFESLPKGALPNRRNIVLSRQELQFPGAQRFGSLEEALAQCQSDEEVFIIGGASVYQEALPLAHKLYVTLVNNTPKEADAFFPEIHPSEWKEICNVSNPVDEKHSHTYAFIDYERK